ncbi:DUF1593 domain-containing protein [Arcicella lustrica]|uniref:DUF1593 domain-containing protein n=1 Tax=Arcicella lustrica TaxID=2984196 RepID=A0ABU5SNA2_9BACT|nr:DUF1593 domain-containing protein [Arcicella sp. DC25W]MEA5428745.1 DUF1593 domain-containing protein [Arcicella sp. DC25W]
MKTKAILFFLISFSLVVQSYSPIQAQKSNINTKSRTIITTDGEIDDVDSFIRMLLYANEFKIEGLVYSSSQWHYKGDEKGTMFISEMENTAKRYGKRTALRWPGTTWIQELLAEYEKVHPNLLQHDKTFPSATALRKLVKVGNIDFEGEMDKETEGSEWIKNILLDNNPQPIYLQIWGGTNTVARALKSIEDTYKNTSKWAEIYEKVSKKAIIYAVLDQDATYKKYIAPNWPKIKVFYNSDQFWCFAYPWPRVVPNELQAFLRGEFMAKNIIQKHGPLLEKYYAWGDGQKQAGDEEHTHGNMADAQKYKMTQYDFISEGDSPAYFQLLDVGLMSKDHPEYGGWGGRMVQSKDNPHRWEDGKHVTDFNPFTNKQDASFPQTRWIEALQLDFAARANWCIKPFKEANHAPKIIVKGNTIKKVKAGTNITLEASAIDPDGNAVDFKFWQYQEAGTSSEKANIDQTLPNAANISIPAGLKTGETIHIIVEGKDRGQPALIRYQRIILTGE